MRERDKLRAATRSVRSLRSDRNLATLALLALDRVSANEWIGRRELVTAARNAALFVREVVRLAEPRGRA